MSKKVKKVALILLMISVVLFSFCTFSLASGTEGTSGAPDPSKYKGSGEANVGGIENLGNQIITIISTVGSIASVIVLIVLGVKYMMGSAEEKAEYKKTLMPYVIGAVLVFAASAIASIIFGFAGTLSGGTSTSTSNIVYMASLINLI